MINTQINKLGILVVISIVFIGFLGCQNQTRSSSSLDTDRLHVTALIKPLSADKWRVAYETNKPVERLVFLRNRGDHRQNGWKFDESGFILSRVGGNDVILREDGASFTTFTAILTPHRDRIEKEYLLFGAFSHGAQRVYAGQFRVTEADVDGQRIFNGTTSSLRFDPGVFETFYLDGEWHQTAVTLEGHTDQGDGYVVYGHVPLTEYAGGGLMIDPGAPDWIRAGLLDVMTDASTYFTERLGAVDDGGFLTLITFLPDPNASGTSIEGGVLADQIHFHLSGSGWQDVDDSLLLHLGWIAAHETAHVWNAFSAFTPDYFHDDNDPNTPEPLNAQWLHEGGADMLTYKALMDTNRASSEYLSSRMNKSLNSCVLALSLGALNSAEDRNRFRDYYDCGLMIGYLVETACAPVGADYIDVWQKMTRLSQGGHYSQARFLEALDICDGTEPVKQVIETITLNEDTDRGALLIKGFDAFGVKITQQDQDYRFVPVGAK